MNKGKDVSLTNKLELLNKVFKPGHFKLSLGCTLLIARSIHIIIINLSAKIAPHETRCNSNAIQYRYIAINNTGYVLQCIPPVNMFVSEFLTTSTA